MQINCIWEDLITVRFERKNAGDWIEAKSIEKSTEIIMMKFESPVGKNYKDLQLRIKYAKEAYKDL